MLEPIRRILLVWPKYELSFWGMQYSLHQVEKDVLMAPLSLITVAGMLPREKYEFRHLDLNYQDLTDEDVQWADLVMLSGWGPMYRSILRVSAKCRKQMKKILIGGPLASEYHQILRSIDHIFIGEVEGFDLEGLLDQIAEGSAPHLITGINKPDMVKHYALPRFDLLDLSRYWLATIQYARGCPFTCEFCDIIELYGRVPRTKEADVVVGELESLYELGHRGPVYFVDDNFYGNRKSIKGILPAVIEFQRRRDYPFYFYTQATVNLAGNPEVLSLMKQAGFYSMYVGIETPSKESLKETKKVQNLKLDLVEAIDILQGYEIYVQSGFIIGFDNDPDNIADLIIDYVETTNLTVAMTGLLLSLPNTQLERRLIAEGRMLETAGIDQFGLPNFITKAQPERVMSGFQKVVRECFGKGSLDRRLNKQLEIFDDAEPRKRAIGRTELQFFAEHFRIYGEKVQQDLEALMSSSKFGGYVEAHHNYWSQAPPVENLVALPTA